MTGKIDKKIPGVGETTRDSKGGLHALFGTIMHFLNILNSFQTL